MRRSRKGKMDLLTERKGFQLRISRQRKDSGFRLQFVRFESRNLFSHNPSRVKSCSVVGRHDPRPERRVALRLTATYPPEGTLCLVLGVFLEFGIWSFQSVPTYSNQCGGGYTNPKIQNRNNGHNGPRRWGERPREPFQTSKSIKRCYCDSELVNRIS
jgi:hypothetical protein